MQYSGLSKLVLEIIKESQPIRAADIAKILKSKLNTDISKEDVNHLLYRHLSDHASKDDSHRWSLKNSNGITQKAIPVEIPKPVAPETNTNAVVSHRFLANRNHTNNTARNKQAENTNGLGLQNLVDYYLESLALERDSEIKLYARPFDENRPNFLVLNGLPIYEDNSFVWPENTRQFVSTRPRSKNVNLYIGYPVFVQKTRPGSSDIVYPLFLFSLQTNDADGTGYPTLDIDPPRINSEAFRRSGTTFGDIQEDLKTMRSTLGLDVDNSHELPTAIELIERLKTKYPLWPWQEAIDISKLSTSDLNSKADGGFYNSAILFWGEGSKFVQGLEAELREISNLAPDRYAKSALAQILGTAPKRSESESPKFIHRHLPLNPSQIDAVKSAMTNPLTVITGPPGTGKSQVVGSIITNAALNGQSVLVSSKNHKAVDVVVSRVNCLADQPFLNKLGAEASTGDIIHLVNILTSRSRQTDTSQYDHLKNRSASLQQEIKAQQEQLDSAIKKRNRVDEISNNLPDDISSYGLHFKLSPGMGSEEKERHFKNVCETIERDLRRLKNAKAAIDTNNMDLFNRCLWVISKNSRIQDAANSIREISSWYGPKVTVDENDLTELVKTCAAQIVRLEEALKVSQSLKEYYHEIPLLSSFDLSANQEKYLSIEEKLSTVDLEFWQEWLRLLPNRLSPEDMQIISSYAALVQLANTGDDSDKRKVSDKLKRITPKVTSVLPAWAVTTLSLRNRIPFDDGLFDLVVIDEASQCDIASAIPLLFRAKRAVIIGDPQQLKHITSLLKATDTRLMNQFGILEHPTWGYSTNSLFDAMASLPITKRFTLNEHHRSDDAIINFSNKHFYDGSLIIATRHKNLKRSKNSPSVDWVHVAGQVTAPSGSGAVNLQEVKSVHAYLRDLLINRGYEGSVGIVTPFRFQANRIRELVEGDSQLQQILERANILIDTVHRFQGDERDIMIFSPVISRGISPSATGFLKSQGNLFNVAITRARSHLVIVGDIDHCRDSDIKYLSAFVKYYEELKTSKPPQISNFDNLPAKHPFSSDPRVSIWEVKFYEELRAAGLSPIPQYNEDKYALDFAIFRNDGAKLDVEVDGEMYHKSWTGQRLRSDIIRNQTLIELGWHVKRFWVYQLKEDMKKCVREIQDWANSKAA